MKILKKLSVIFLALILVLSLVSPAFAVEITDLTFLYIDKGNITIGDNYVSGYGFFGQKITAVNKTGYCIAMTGTNATSNTVVVEGGSNFITLKNVKINVEGYFDCAFEVCNGATTDIFFTGENSLKSGSARAGLEISEDSTVILSGDGTLMARSAGEAGIGGGNGMSNGTLIINSGTIKAQCLDESAGIGGGSSGTGGNITINGGNVYALGGSYAAGIGGGDGSDGGNITINGGTVTAIGGEDAAGIGGGWYGEMGNIVINGGSVKAVGNGAPNIGAGSGLKTTDAPVNSDGEKVYAVTVDTSALSNIKTIYGNGKDVSICGEHPSDKNYYIYLPAGTGFVSVESESAPAVYKANITEKGATTTKINPVTAKNGAEIGDDYIIRGIRCGLRDLSDYLTLQSGYTLAYDNEFMGTGTHATVMYGDTPVVSYRTLLYGDLNNDGFYDGADSFMVLAFLWDMLTPANTDKIIVEAADADRDGAITDSDMYLLENAGLLRASVRQNADMTITSDGENDEYISLIDQTPLNKSSEKPVVEDISEAIKTENTTNILKLLIDFIKNALKLFFSVNSFWKIYFI